MNPGFHFVIEELCPLISSVEHQRATEEEVLEAKRSCHSTEIEQIPILAVVFQRHFVSWGCVQCVLFNVPINIIELHENVIKITASDFHA
jgi:hypothetical protein